VVYRHILGPLQFREDDMTKPRLTFAFANYDRFIPLLDGSVSASGFDIEALQVGQSDVGRDGTDRHERMLIRKEFDVAEVSLSSYLMAHDRKQPFTAIPFFPRRLFSQSQIWVNTDRNIREPRDLIGKRIGLSTFQTTLSVLAKGDLQSEYGVPWRSIEWAVEKDETIAFTPQQGVTIRKIPSSTNIGRLLQTGEIDAIFRPRPPQQALEGAADIRRLFPDIKAEETKFFRKRGYYPIMHVVAFRDDVLERNPDAAPAFLELLQRIDKITEGYWDDPNWSRLAWGRLHLEEERRLLGPDIWPSGIARNRKNLEDFVGYAHDQGLISEQLRVDELFAGDTWGS
jgi:4,5-dihydroxyphthalate decarboxylase